ncbi:MAG: hypothetical protein IIW54_14225 [Lachnospiraceae bacterium]|nr:hypothetical protein [Lachnospiraceae bacterium]
MQHRRLLIVGAGQYGHVVKEIAEFNADFEMVSFLDDSSDDAVGKIVEAERFVTQYSMAIVAIGNAEIRRQLTMKLVEYGYEIATLIHPKATISSSAKVGMGCVIEAGAVLNTASELCEGVFVSPGAVVNHNSTVGQYSHIDCNAVVEAGSNVPANIKLVSGSVFSKKLV